MKKQKVNIDELFEEARREPLVFTKEEARSLLESHSANGGVHHIKKLIYKEFTPMNIVIATLTAAAAIGFFTLNPIGIFTGSHDNMQKSTNAQTVNQVPSKGKDVNNTKIDIIADDAKPAANQQVVTNKIIKSDIRHIDDDDLVLQEPVLVDSNKETDNKNQKIKETDSKSPKIDLSHQVDVKRSNFIELSPQNLKVLGITTTPDQELTLWEDQTSNTRLVLSAKFGGVSFRKADPKTLAELDTTCVSPTLITDNAGNQKVFFRKTTVTRSNADTILFDDRNLDYLKYNSDSIVKKKIDNFELKIKSLDSNTTLGFSFSIPNKPNIAELEIQANAQEEKAREIEKKLHKTEKDLRWNTDELKKGAEEIRQKAMEMIKKFKNDNNSSNNDNDSLNNEPSKKMEIYMPPNVFFENFNGDMKETLLDLKLGMKKTIGDIVNDSVFALRLKIRIKNANEDIKNINDFININKLIPLKVSMGKNTNKNEWNNNEDYAFILWYEPTPEFISTLPEDLQKRLEPELQALKNKACNICEAAPVMPEHAYLDVWRSCSGAVENLIAYPNPTNGPLSVKFDLKEIRSIEITLHDLSGRTIRTLKPRYNEQAGTIEEKFDLKDVQSGMYLLSIQTDKGEQAVQRVIIGM